MGAAKQHWQYADYYKLPCLLALGKRKQEIKQKAAFLLFSERWKLAAQCFFFPPIAQRAPRRTLQLQKLRANRGALVCTSGSSTEIQTAGLTRIQQCLQSLPNAAAKWKSSNLGRNTPLVCVWMCALSVITSSVRCSPPGHYHQVFQLGTFYGFNNITNVEIRAAGH